MLTVYYDGKCGLCRREIAHYKKIAPPDAFTWVDLTRHPEALRQKGISLADGLMYLHARDEQNRMHVGFPVFLLIWRRLGGVWRWLGVFMGLPGVRHVAGWCYVRFAHWRFARLGHCQTAKAEEDAGP